MITDASLVELVENHPGLETIYLRWIYRFTGNFIEKLATSCSSLSSLSLSNCTQLNDEKIQPLIFLAKLQTFLLERSENVTDKSIAGILQSNSSTLKNISLIQCKSIEEQGLVKSLSLCTLVENLVIDGIASMTDDGVCHIVQSFPKLQNFSLSNTEKIQDTSISFLAKVCGPKLKTLTLGKLPQMTKESLLDLTKYCHNLTRIDLSWCRDVDDEIAESFVKNCKLLSRITLWGCHRVTDVMVGLMLKKSIEVIGKDQFLIIPC